GLAQLRLIAQPERQLREALATLEAGLLQQRLTLLRIIVLNALQSLRVRGRESRHQERVGRDSLSRSDDILDNRVTVNDMGESLADLDIVEGRVLAVEVDIVGAEVVRNQLDLLGQVRIFGDNLIVGRLQHRTINRIDLTSLVAGEDGLLLGSDDDDLL